MNTKIEAMLVEIGERVESLDSDVNSGGCGIYAYELLKRLSKNGIVGKIVVYHDTNTWYMPTDWNMLFFNSFQRNFKSFPKHLTFNNQSVILPE